MSCAAGAIALVPAAGIDVDAGGDKVARGRVRSDANAVREGRDLEVGTVDWRGGREWACWACAWRECPCEGAACGREHGSRADEAARAATRGERWDGVEAGGVGVVGLESASLSGCEWCRLWQRVWMGESGTKEATEAGSTSSAAARPSQLLLYTDKHRQGHAPFPHRHRTATRPPPPPLLVLALVLPPFLVPVLVRLVDPPSTGIKVHLAQRPRAQGHRHHHGQDATHLHRPGRAPHDRPQDPQGPPRLLSPSPSLSTAPDSPCPHPPHIGVQPAHKVPRPRPGNHLRCRRPGQGPSLSRSLPSLARSSEPR